MLFIIHAFNTPIVCQGPVAHVAHVRVDADQHHGQGKQIGINSNFCLMFYRFPSLVFRLVGTVIMEF